MAKKLQSIIDKENEIKEVETMTDEQVDELTNYLSENVSDKNKVLREMEEKALTEEEKFPFNVLNKGDLREGSAKITVNPKTGEHVILGPAEESPVTVNIENFEDKNILESVKEETITNSLKEFGLTDEDALQFTKVLLKHNRKEKFNVLKELPESVISIARTMAQTNNTRDVATTARFLMDYISREIRIDQEYIDLQDTIKQELSNIPEFTDQYADYLKEKMEDDLLQKADLLEKEGKIDKAEVLRKVSKAFTDSYKMDRLIEAINNGEIRRLDKKVKRINNLMRDFNYKYKESRFMINDIGLIENILIRKVDISMEDALLIIACICEYTKNMSPEVPEEHAFMYYTIKNILSLDYITSRSDFQTELKQNIIKLLKVIKTKGVK